MKLVIANDSPDMEAVLLSLLAEMDAAQAPPADAVPSDDELSSSLRGYVTEQGSGPSSDLP